MSDEPTEVQLGGPLEAVFADPKLVQENIKIFREALPKLLDPAVDMVTIQGKEFIRKSGWNVINAYFNVHTKPTNSWRVEMPEGEYTIVVVVEAEKNGRRVSRSAECSSLEMKGKHGGKDYSSLQSNCYGMAETRAVGRASAAWFMVGDVSAEEVEGSPGVVKSESEWCACAYEKVEFTTDGKGCRTCKKQISEIKAGDVMRRFPNKGKEVKSNAS